MSFCISTKKHFQNGDHLVFVLSFLRQIHQTVTFGLQGVSSSAVIKMKTKMRGIPAALLPSSSSAGPPCGGHHAGPSTLRSQLVVSQSPNPYSARALLTTFSPGCCAFRNFQSRCLLMWVGGNHDLRPSVPFSCDCSATRKLSADKMGPDT